MKKVLSLLLAAVLAGSLALPMAAAAESADSRLSQVTRRVKETLDIGEEYESFYGELQEAGAAPRWLLQWSGEDAGLSVTAGEDGKVYSYSRSVNQTAGRDGEGLPTFPAVSRQQAQAAAQAFLDRVLTAGETAAFQEDQALRAGTQSYRLRGTVRLNGLDSPIGFSVTVQAEDGTVTRFSRDDLYETYLGGIPSAVPFAGAQTAGGLLKGVLSLRLEYVLEGERAVLRYLPDDIDAYYVDAATGKLVNLTERYREIGGRAAVNGANTAAAGAEAAMDKGESGLSAAEQAGIAKLEGVRSREDLDGAVQAVRELGLDRYTLSGCTYSVDRESGDVTARLQYARQAEDGVWRRTVLVDAKTGALQAVSSTAPYEKTRRAAVTAAAAQETAEAFLRSLWGGDYAACALYRATPWSGESYGASHSFLYAQRENGYFFCENRLSVSVDVTDGSISALSRDFDTDAVFDGPDGILAAQAALDAWFATYTVELAYLAVPQALDASMPEAKPLLEQGASYQNALKLSYTLEREADLAGIDAKTGKPVAAGEDAGTAAIAYDDLEGCWAGPQAEELASYGVGWLGGSLAPARPLTQLDMVALLASTEGYWYDPAQDPEGLYAYAYAMGLITPAERDDGHLLTRAETVKLLLDAAGYGRAARLTGIFRCSYTDAARIPAAYYGYAAIAQGLGIVSGDAAGGFAPNRTATRLEALVMLYRYMNR